MASSTTRSRTLTAHRSKSASSTKATASSSARSGGHPSSTQSSKKRKLQDFMSGEDTGSSSHKPVSTNKTPSSTSKKQKKATTEKRLRVFRKKAPQSFLQKLERAQTQRMIVIGRTRIVTEEELREDIDIVGTTGNIYRVSIAKLPVCTCPDHKKGHECKHKVYALHTILKAPEHLQYQLAFTTDELEEIFMNGPSIPNDSVDSKEEDGKRKPIEGECPICYMDLEPEENEILWCKGGCGNNVHKSCFDQWARSQRGTEVRCVYCRAPWESIMNDIKTIEKAGEKTGEGYINVADQFGMSRVRDYSTYYQPWAIRNLGGGF